MNHEKAENIDEHISRLRGRGMQFADEAVARRTFARISYSRIKGYWADLLEEESSPRFRPGASFEKVLDRYTFDQELRHLLFGAIETIEVALRASIINNMSLAAGHGLWYLDLSLFQDADQHLNFIHRIKHEFGRSKEPFACAYRESCTDWREDSLEGDNPDAWKIIEVATLGMLSHMYKNLKPQLPQRTAIAKDFGIYSAKEFANLIECMATLRNVIAHHARLWNRNLHKQVRNIGAHRGVWLNTPLTPYQRNRPYGFITAVLFLSNAVCPNNNMQEQLLSLLRTYSHLPLHQIGFTDGWEDEPIWQPRRHNAIRNSLNAVRGVLSALFCTSKIKKLRKDLEG